MSLRLATWNVNSLRVRLPQVLAWLDAHAPDVLCLQETKLEDPAFPTEALQNAGYHALYAGQKTYNGVAILSRADANERVDAIPNFSDAQKRVLAATVGDTRVICLYVPNGESVESEKYQYKLAWLKAVTAWLKDELARHPKLIVTGDFNIAPDERDVYDPAKWENSVLFSAPERQAFQTLLALGLHDSFRLFEQPEKSYTWWDYRMNMFKRKLGLRIDHILISNALTPACKRCVIDTEPRKNERPSDHAPVMAEFEI